MKATEFCYWLQGFFEIDGVSPRAGAYLTCEQVEIIQRHLALVFKHDIDPKVGSTQKKAELQQIHDGKPTNTGHGSVLIRC
jgi:hypothetical protein